MLSMHSEAVNYAAKISILAGMCTHVNLHVVSADVACIPVGTHVYD